ncbi:MAG: hypothetical protein AB7S38_19040 [Vulcanimicrobiota bacterium]
MRRLLFLTLLLALAGCQPANDAFDLPTYPGALFLAKESGDKDMGDYIAYTRVFMSNHGEIEVRKHYDELLAKQPGWNKLRPGHWSDGNCTPDSSFYYCKAVDPNRKGGYIVAQGDADGTHIRMFEVVPKSALTPTPKAE